jgi:hypothetical protein
MVLFFIRKLLILKCQLINGSDIKDDDIDRLKTQFRNFL